MSLSRKTSWDTHSWCLGLILGNCAGLLLLCGGNSDSRRFLESAFPYSVLGYYTGDFVLLLGIVLGGLIFPFILASVAKRLYAFWGLLPIILLVLWIIAGDIVAHRISALFNPHWAMPLFVLLCWIVSSYPITLFRYWRQTHRRPAVSTFKQAVQSQVVRRACLFALLTAFLAIVSLGWYNFLHPPHFQVSVTSHWADGKEAHVPLIKHGHGLYVTASLNGQKEVCRLDTGSDRVEWPRELHLRGRLTSQHGLGCDFLDGCVATQTIVLPEIQIGGYSITNLPTEMSDGDSRLFTRPQRTHYSEEPLLGNPAFVMTVLTIDYKNAEMIIHPPQYDFMRQRRKPGDRVVEMGWTSDYSAKDWQQSFYGWPAMMAAIGNASFWCTLDTGWGRPDIGLSKNFVDQHPFIKQTSHDLSPFDATYSSSLVDRFHGLEVKFPCSAPPYIKPLMLKLNGIVSPNNSMDQDTGGEVIGFALMERYRITIDYPRGSILLEPYSR